jgi:hypothetical protein
LFRLSIIHRRSLRVFWAIVSRSTTAWKTAKAYLENTVGVTGLPDDLDTYEKRMQAVNAIKDELDAMTQKAQEDMIDLQSLTAKRDQSYDMISNILKSLNTTLLANVNNM